MVFVGDNNVSPHFGKGGEATLMFLITPPILRHMIEKVFLP